MVYKIDRQTWYRGQGASTSKLLRHDGMRCCIGFVGQQCGMADEDMRDMSDVLAAQHNSHWPEWFEDGDSSDLGRAYDVNDERTMSEQARESLLTEIFARHNDALIFEN